jgi:hypothetical protein
MTTTDDIIHERGNTYGDFNDGIMLEATILDAILNRHYEQHGKSMPLKTMLYFSKIAMKLSRLSVSPNHIDSWTDIAGYARLVELQLKKEENA